MKVFIVLAAVGAVLAATGAAAAPRDGMIVFVSSRDGVDGVYAVRPDGSGLTRLVANAGSPRVSPDGRHVVYHTGNFAFRVRDLGTGEEHALKGDIGVGWAFTPRPWSPDGTKFAVGADDGLHVFTSDGAVVGVLGDGDAAAPSWSPDGKWIAYSTYYDGVFVVRSSGAGTARRLAPKADQPLWSPDGAEIAYQGPSALFVVPVGGGTPRRIGVGFAAWAPDNATLALASDSELGVAGLALYDRRGTLERRLLRGTAVADPEWSPDGRWVTATVDGDLWLFARDGSTKRQLTQGRRWGYMNSEPSWAAGMSSVAGVPVAARTTQAGPLVALRRADGKAFAGFPSVAGRAPQESSTGPYVRTVISDGRGGWYVGGDFGWIGAVACPNLAHLTASLRVDRGWCPSPDGPVRGLLRVGGTLVVGGEMNRIAGAHRAGLAAFSLATGRLTRWAPAVSGGVFAVAADPSSRTIYLSGTFTRVAGARRWNFAAVDARTGAPSRFAPNPDTDRHGDGIWAFAVTARRVYAAGAYEHIGGKPARFPIDALDPSTGSVLDGRPLTDGGVNVLTADGDRVFAGGAFKHLGGLARVNLASFSGSTAAVDAWRPALGTRDYVVRATPAGSLVLAALWPGGGNAAQRVAAFAAATGARTWLSPLRFRGTVETLATDATFVLVGGSFRDARSG